MKKFKKINFKELNKRNIALVGLIVLIAIAGYININYNEPTVETMATVDKTEVKEEKDEYSNAIIERDSKRSKSIDVYKNIVNDTSCDAATKEKAQNELLNSAKNINNENTIEASIKAKGILKSVVYIEENNISVIVFDDNLTDSKITQIKDIVTQNTGFTADKIKIIKNK